MCRGLILYFHIIGLFGFMAACSYVERATERTMSLIQSSDYSVVVKSVNDTTDRGVSKDFIGDLSFSIKLAMKESNLLSESGKYRYYLSVNVIDYNLDSYLAWLVGKAVVTYSVEFHLFTASDVRLGKVTFGDQTKQKDVKSSLRLKVRSAIADLKNHYL